MEMPSLAPLGVPSILAIDNAALTNIYGPFTQCIWASNEFIRYEIIRHIGLAAGLFSPCPPGGFPAESARGAEYTGVNAWQYKSYSSADPPAFSLNRTRTVLSGTDYRCGTSPYPTCAVANSLARWECLFRDFGVWAILDVAQTGSVFKFRVRVVVQPRVHKKDIGYTYRENRTTHVRQANQYVDSTDDYYQTHQIPGSSGAPTACLGALYPNASPLNNIYQAHGLLLRYEKTVNCATDFLGNPVVLNLVESYMAGTQTKTAALGITNVPSTVTITAI